MLSHLRGLWHGALLDISMRLTGWWGCAGGQWWGSPKSRQDPMRDQGEWWVPLFPPYAMLKELLIPSTAPV